MMCFFIVIIIHIFASRLNLVVFRLEWASYFLLLDVLAFIYDVTCKTKCHS